MRAARDICAKTSAKERRRAAAYEDLDRVARRVLGRDNDVTREFRLNMEAAQAKLKAHNPS